MTHFYVSAINGTRKHLIAGPYPTHDEALAQVEAARALGEKRDPYSWFFAWGTCGSDSVLKTPLGAGWTG